MANDIVIRLLENEQLIDCVDGTYEDSFTLETFSSIIETFKKGVEGKPKNWIVARVQTWDKKQPGKAYYSYYDAFQLNKVLFKTQVYLGQKMIHRLQVLNPLTNTDIIGNVLYFIINLNNKNNDSITTTNIIASNPLQDIHIPIPEEETDDGALLEKVPDRKSRQAPPPLKLQSGNTENNCTLGFQLSYKMESSLDLEPPSFTSGSFKMNQGLKKSISTPLRKYSTENDESAKVVVEDIPVTFRGSKRRTTLSAVYRFPGSPDILQVKEQAFVPVPVGTVTRFNVPLTIEEREGDEGAITPPQRKRSLALANSAHQPTEKFYKEWVTLIRSPSFPPVRSPTEGSVASQAETTLIAHEEEDKFKEYIGSYLGTDMDYLQKAEIREKFLQNALDPADCKLLEMPPVTEANQRADADLMLLYEGENICCSGGERERRCMEFLVLFIVILVLVMFIVLLIRILKK